MVEVADDTWPTTEEDFEAFVDEAKFWIARFGLKGWGIDFKVEDIGSRAILRMNVSGRRAVVSLAKDFGGGFTKKDVRRSAFHEVCELLLARTWDVALKRDLTPDQRRDALEEAQHEVIRILENTIFEDAHAKKESKQ